MAKAKAEIDPTIYISASEVLNMSLKDAAEEATGQRPRRWPPHIVERVNTAITEANDAGFADEEAKAAVVEAMREAVVEHVWTPPEPPEPEAEADEQAAEQVEEAAETADETQKEGE